MRGCASVRGKWQIIYSESDDNTGIMSCLAQTHALLGKQIISLTSHHHIAA